MIHIKHNTTPFPEKCYFFSLLPDSTERILYMILPYFASFIVFIILLTYEIRKNTRLAKKIDEGFWDREVKANSTRKKSLEHLDYLKVPLESLPFHIENTDLEFLDIHARIQTLADKKIVNLTGLTNTDLKMMYGAANLTLLSQYDQDYTLLVRTLQKWASLLYQKGYPCEAQTILEYAISTKTDVSGTYKLLATIYQNTNQTSRIEELLQIASTLQSAMQKPIVRMLQEFDQHSDLPHS